MKSWIAMFAVAAVSYGAVKPLVEGNPQAAVRVVVYEDLQCPDCAAFRVMLDQKLLPKYGSRVAFEHRDFPLPKHKWARPAAIAARYFESVKPALAVEWRRYAMANLKSITPETFNEQLSAWARSHGADPAKVIAALDDKTLAAAVEDDYQEGIARGIAHTPTVLVEGDPFIETFTVEEISASLDKHLGGK